MWRIPSDEDAVRMHVLTTSEEQQYFKRAGKHRDLHDLGRLMLNQGPRPDELVSLLKTDVDLGVPEDVHPKRKISCHAAKA
jgi:hypothetical protein